MATQQYTPALVELTRRSAIDHILFLTLTHLSIVANKQAFFR
ncbi:hypothetical protein Slin_3870 [Spirosoma linguale DSM 74]|uniref:Uncharacterized protein n=1 Tax=Spirosoma linguale (strain ATCC 33905 / DSM 74 / LMG 10896 / Claus 1) TaxID=504472 RepID=D2QHR1_SPILD|nr:hypothetical protein Slin_3870 [Spirosoma linguale DSM 74]